MNKTGGLERGRERGGEDKKVAEIKFALDLASICARQQGLIGPITASRTDGPSRPRWALAAPAGERTAHQTIPTRLLARSQRTTRETGSKSSSCGHGGAREVRR